MVRGSGVEVAAAGEEEALGEEENMVRGRDGDGLGALELRKAYEQVNEQLRVAKEELAKDVALLEFPPSAAVSSRNSGPMAFARSASKAFVGLLQDTVVFVDEMREFVQITDELTETLQYPREGSSARRLSDLLNEKEQVSRDLENLNARLNLVSLLRGLNQNLRLFDSFFKDGKVLNAARLIGRMRQALAAVTQQISASTSPSSFSYAMKEIAKREKKLKVRLEEIFERMIQFDANFESMTVFKSIAYGGRLIEIDQVRRAIKMMDLIPRRRSRSKIGLTSDETSDDVISMVINGTKLFLLSALNIRNKSDGKERSVRIEQISNEHGDYTSYLLDAATDVNSKSATEQLLSKTREVLSLLVVNIFGEDLNAKDKAFSSLLGLDSWREICDHIISTFLSDPIASSPAESDYIDGSTAHLMASFEEFCSSIGFISSSDGLYLKKFVENIKTHRIEHQIKKLISEARVIISDSDFAVAPADGRLAVAAPRYFESSSVSITKTVYELSNLIRHFESELLVLNTDTKEEEAETKERFRNAIANVWDMYRIMMTVRHATSLASVPLIAALFCNDCFFISAQLQETSRTLGPFHEKISHFQRLGMSYLSLQLKKQEDVMMEHIKSAEGFGETYIDARSYLVHNAIKKSVHHLTQLSKIWKEVLPAHIYFQLLGDLVSTACKEFIGGLLSLKDISEQETHKLSSSLGHFLELKEIIFGPNKSDAVIEKYTKEWKKFVNLVAVLEMSMIVIVEKYRAGKLEGFSADEVRHLIMALFSDSPFRTQNLQKIA